MRFGFGGFRAVLAFQLDGFNQIAFGVEVFVVIFVCNHHATVDTAHVHADRYPAVAGLLLFLVIPAGHDQFDVSCAVGLLPGDPAFDIRDFGDDIFSLPELVHFQHVRIEEVRIDLVLVMRVFRQLGGVALCGNGVVPVEWSVWITDDSDGHRFLSPGAVESQVTRVTEFFGFWGVSLWVLLVS